MLVKNIGKKVLGFGSLALPPDAVDRLPAGYDMDHLVVKFMFAKKWLVQVKSGKPNNPITNPPPQDPPPPELTEEEKAEAQRRADLEAKISAVRRMNLEPVREEATALGIEIAENDTRDTLRQKVIERLQAEMG